MSAICPSCTAPYTHVADVPGLCEPPSTQIEIPQTLLPGYLSRRHHLTAKFALVATNTNELATTVKT